MDTKLRIVPGAGQPIDIDVDVANRQEGTVEEALRRIITDEIHDPELLALLDDASLSMEEFTVDEAGNAHEALLSPGDDWSRIVEHLKDRTVELGVARRMRGGAWARAREEGQGSGEGRSSGLSSVRSYRQSLVEEPADYQLSPDDVQAIANGRALFITGRALRSAEFICRVVASSEIMWYWTASVARPHIVCGITIPEQRASASSCSTDGSEVIRMNRDVRKDGLLIVAAGHSHGSMGVFTSQTDHEAMKNLSAERVGWTSRSRIEAEGRIEHAASSERSDQAGQPECEQKFVVSFPDSPDASLAICSAHADLQPEDLQAHVRFDRRRLVSFFSTHNARGHHHFPVYKLENCTHCGGRVRSGKSPGTIPVHVIGPKRISDEDRRRLSAQIEAKVSYGYGWGHTYYQRDKTEDRQYGECNESRDNEPVAVGQVEELPGAFEVSRNGRVVGCVPAIAMEKAASCVPELAIALGWNDQTETQVQLDNE